MKINIAIRGIAPKPTPTDAPWPWRTFQNTNKGHSKFWNVRLVDCKAGGYLIETVFGKIGASGTKWSDSFKVLAEAEKIRNSLIRQKTTRGYVETIPQGEYAPSPASTLTASVRDPTPFDLQDHVMRQYQWHSGVGGLYTIRHHGEAVYIGRNRAQMNMDLGERVAKDCFDIGAAVGLLNKFGFSVDLAKAARNWN